MGVNEIRIGQAMQENLLKVYVNTYEDFIYLNEKDSSLFDRFAAFIKWLEDKAADIASREKMIQEKYGEEIIQRDDEGRIEDFSVDALIEYAKLRTDTYREASEKIDLLFGTGTCRKYFRAFYEVNPDFVPDDECIFDFLEEITPVLNGLFADRKKRIELKYNRGRTGAVKRKYRSVK